MDNILTSGGGVSWGMGHQTTAGTCPITGTSYWPYPDNLPGFVDQLYLYRPIPNEPLVTIPGDYSISPTPPIMKKQTDVFLYSGDGVLLKTCDDLKEAEREAKRLAAKTEDEVRIVRCVKVVRPKAVEVETEDV